MNQLTLKEAFTVTGKGLHSGLEITATFKPAPENHGYKCSVSQMLLQGSSKARKRKNSLLQL